jgi:hypothetical protein
MCQLLRRSWIRAGLKRIRSNAHTVHDVSYDLLRSLGLATVFENPGSTEQTFLQWFPDDFTYVLALQEASVLAMADGFAQATRSPALSVLALSRQLCSLPRYRAVRARGRFHTRGQD